MSEPIILNCKKHLLQSIVYCSECKKKLCNQCLDEESNCQDSGHSCISIKKYKETILSFSQDPKKKEELIQRKYAIEKALESHREAIKNTEFSMNPEILKQKQTWIQATIEENKKLKAYISKMNDILFILTNADAKINYFIRKSQDLTKASDIEEYFELNNEMKNYFNIIDQSINYIQKNEQYFQEFNVNFLLEDGEENKILNGGKESLLGSKYKSGKKTQINNSIQNLNNPKLDKIDLELLSKFGEKNNFFHVLFYLNVDPNLTLHLFNLNSCNNTKKCLDYNTSEINDVDATIIHNWILICGGTWKGQASTRTIGIMIKDDNNLEEYKLDDLKKPRSCSHTLVSNNKNAYCLGGYPSIKECEKFILEKNQWIDKFPPLNFENQLITACILKEKYLYCFGGYLSDAIEKLDLNLEDKWGIVNLTPNCRTRYWGLCIEIEVGTALIFGGGENSSKISTLFQDGDDNYTDLQSLEFDSKNDLMEYFNGTKAIIYDNKILFVSPYQKLKYEISLEDWAINSAVLDF